MAGNFKVNCLCSLLSAGVFIAGFTFLLVTAFPIAQITIGMVYMYECPAVPVIPVYVLVCGILALLVMGVFALPNLLCPAALGNRIWTVLILTLILFVFLWLFYGSYQVYSIYPPNYNKNIISQKRVKTYIYTPTVPDNKLHVPLWNQNQNQNQNESLQNLNHTQMINNNKTLRKLIQIMASSNTSHETNRDFSLPYCNRTVYLFAFWTTTLVYILTGNALVMFICLYGFMKIANKLTELLTT